MTEQQPYDVVRTESDFEIRLYPEHLVAEVEVDGTFESAGSTAFRPLVSYISGRNHAGAGLAMTAPVIQRRDDEPLPHDLESTTTNVGPGRYTVSFVLPATATVDSVPTPDNTDVHVHKVPEQYAVATRFSGRWSSSSYQAHVAALTTAIAAAGLTPVGSARFARFDPPWTPWFMRRNEVVIPISAP